MRFLITFYRLFVSPLLGSNCRFYPTCSTYMQEAIASFGYKRGLKLGLKRLCRCHPWGKGGVDPVPHKEGFIP